MGDPQSGLDRGVPGWEGKMGRAKMLVVTVRREGVKIRKSGG